MKPPLPTDEEKRLEKLRQYEILDTAAEQAFDDITRLASDVCKTSISLLTFIDQNRQCFKSNVGLPIAETSRDIAFCSRAILQPDIFIVPDTLSDERFAKKPTRHARSEHTVLRWDAADNQRRLRAGNAVRYRPRAARADAGSGQQDPDSCSGCSYAFGSETAASLVFAACSRVMLRGE